MVKSIGIALLALASMATASDPLERYLVVKFPAEIRQVEVRGETVRITGIAPPDGADFDLAEIPMDRRIDDRARFEARVPVVVSKDGRFQTELPRRRERGEGEHDRLLSRWQLVEESGEEVIERSHARYADAVACRSPGLPVAESSSKKGLGGWSAGRIPGELEALGISAVTVNVMVHTLVALEPGPGRTSFEWQGKTYFARDEALGALDRTFLEAAANDAMVSAILLIANPAREDDPVVALLGHPDAEPDGIFAMPNVTSPDGAGFYGAALNLMAERWSRPDGKFGRVHHWIMHNEIDAGRVWTNAGEKSAVAYMDLYQRSMRMMHLIARQYDPHAEVFISLTHHWAERGQARWYGSREMLRQLVRFCRTEGDFPWALAFHPYPQDLFEPRAWQDEQAVFSLDTPKVTPRNLEVLEAFMRLPENLHEGKVRTIHLTENGFNSRDYSGDELSAQAAGMAMAWKKLQALPAIEMWHYHNWIDNRHEGGLRIGLRKFPDDPDDPHGKKPIWHLYQALGAAGEDAACDSFLKIIGIDDWREIQRPLESIR